VTLLAALLSAAVVGAASSPFPPDNKCDLPEERQVVACTEEQRSAWDKSLNAEYRAALGRVVPEQKPLLIKAQRIWVQYRDANCAVGFAHGGTVSSYLGEQCLLDMTRERTKELRGLHDDDTD
jgi:uncharacterized protein YecT (DUF1311 family)